MGSKEDKFDKFDEMGQLPGGYDVSLARQKALEHARKDLSDTTNWLRGLSLLWEIKTAHFDEDDDCYKVVVLCYPEDADVLEKAQWEYHIDAQGNLYPGTPMLISKGKWEVSKSGVAEQKSKFCVYCGQTNGIGATFCSSCGKELPLTKEEEAETAALKQTEEQKLRKQREEAERKRVEEEKRKAEEQKQREREEAERKQLEEEKRRKEDLLKKEQEERERKQAEEERRRKEERRKREEKTAQKRADEENRHREAEQKLESVPSEAEPPKKMNTLPIVVGTIAFVIVAIIVGALMLVGGGDDKNETSKADLTPSPTISTDDDSHVDLGVEDDQLADSEQPPISSPETSQATDDIQPPISNPETPSQVCKLTINIDGQGTTNLGASSRWSVACGVPVDVTTKPDAGWQFSEWFETVDGMDTPHSSGNSLSFTVLMDRDRIVTIRFVPIPDDLTLTGASKQKLQMYLANIELHEGINTIDSEIEALQENEEGLKDHKEKLHNNILKVNGDTGTLRSMKDSLILKGIAAFFCFALGSFLSSVFFIKIVWRGKSKEYRSL